jgi:predicted dehydrogenase
MQKEQRLLRVGVLGCGPIAQFAHFEACRKARNAELYAICDLADDLRERMAIVHQPRIAYRDYDAMLDDDQVEAVIVAIADQFHVDAAVKALDAGKHVLVEKPLGIDVESCLRLKEHASRSSSTVQIGNNRRFDPGITFAHRFITEELGGRIAFKAWYYDSVYRYTMTDNLQPIPIQSKQARRPSGDPKADKRRYFLLTHGSHLVDTARFLGGPIKSVTARIGERYGAYCWFISLNFEDGSLGHLDLHIPIRGDFQEGFQIHGENGSVTGRVHLPWFHKSSEVECFSTRDRQFHRTLGEDAHTYKRQVEGFADAILHGIPQIGATLDDGIASVRTMVAIARSVESGEEVRLDDVTGAV